MSKEETLAILEKIKEKNVDQYRAIIALIKSLVK